MSAFCVFGVSRTDCLRIAEKKVKRYDDEKKRNLTMEEWRAQVDALARDLFNTTTRHRQVSPAFDAPQFALDHDPAAAERFHDRIRIPYVSWQLGRASK